MVLSGGPVTTVAVQIPLKQPNLEYYAPAVGNESCSVGEVGVSTQKWTEAESVDQQQEQQGGVHDNAIGAEVVVAKGKNVGGLRTPGLSVCFTFRSFAEADAHRTLAWNALCCGLKEDDGTGAGPYGTYLYAPHKGLSSFKEVSTSSDINTTNANASSVLDSKNNTSSTGQHEYQSLDSDDEMPIMSPMCCNIMDCGPCCPSISYCVGEIVGTEVTLLEERFTSKSAMFTNKLDDFHYRILITRIVSYIMLSMAFFLILKPVASVLSFVPLIGTLFMNVFWIASLLVGFILGVLISAAAWVLYRPQLLAGKIVNSRRKIL